MPEETQTAEVQTTSTAETTAPASQTEQQTTSTGEGQQTTTSGEQSKTSDAGTGESAKTDKGQSAKQDTKQDFKPKSRGSAKFRIQQLTTQVNDLKKQLGQPEADAEHQDEGAPQEDAGQKPDVAQEVQRHLKPIVDEFSKNTDDTELKEFFSGDMAGEKDAYEGKIREAWNLPQYKDLAASDVFKILNYDSAVEAAKASAIAEYKEAEKQAREQSSGGNSSANRSGPQPKAAADMTPQELQAHNDKVKAGQKP